VNRVLAVDVLNLLAADGAHSAAASEMLEASEVWSAYRSQRHDLFLPAGSSEQVCPTPRTSPRHPGLLLISFLVPAAQCVCPSVSAFGRLFMHVREHSLQWSCSGALSLYLHVEAM
jgi:hypothetical protein